MSVVNMMSRVFLGSVLGFSVLVSTSGCVQSGDAYVLDTELQSVETLTEPTGAWMSGDGSYMACFTENGLASMGPTLESLDDEVCFWGEGSQIVDESDQPIAYWGVLQGDLILEFGLECLTEGTCPVYELERTTDFSCD